MATHTHRASLAHAAKGFKEIYGLWISATVDPLNLEMEMIRRGGSFRNTVSKKIAGMGLAYHFKEAIKLIWPYIKFHKWLDMIIDNYVTHRTIVIIGPASSGKTLGAALCVLLDYYCYPSSTTVIICSTTKERLEDRIWGELKKLHRDACERYSWLPGNLIEGRMRLVTDHRSMAKEGRDFRNGIVGVPCKRGGEYTGLGDFVGLKNKRVRLLGDELSLLPRVWVDSISNLDKNADFKALGLGNAKDTTDALGVLAEPATRLGGWEAGLDQVPVSKTWEIRRPNGICIQLVGSESPNLDGKLGIPLITQEAIDRDVAFYGKDSLWFTMMCQGMMPRGQGSRRVLTRQQCMKMGAMQEPQWLNSQRTKIAFLDAAYRGVGGDRCVFGTLEFGFEANVEVDPGTAFVTSMINHSAPTVNKRHILAITLTTVVPIKDGPGIIPEDQIVAFCQKHCEDNAIPPENFFYDSGMRTSLVQAFGRIWTPRVNSIDCGGKPTDRRVSGDIDMACSAYYSKRITEIWYSVALTVQCGQFRGLTEDVMMEFCSREYGIVGANKIEVEPKEKMKEKTGRSPDLADAVAIGVEGARTRGFVIKSNRPSKLVKSDDRWKKELKERAQKLREGRTLRAA